MADKSKKLSSSGADQNRKAHHDLMIWAAAVVLLAAGLATAVVFAVSEIHPRWFERNPRMTVRRIRISSSGDYWNSPRGRKELLNRLDLNDEEPLPLWEIDPGELRAELEDPKKFSSVHSAKVSLWMPDTLEIILTERTPVAFLFSRDSPVVVDDSGMLIKRDESMAAEGNWEELPLITGLEPRVGIGERDPRLAPAVALITEVRKNREPDRKIEIDRIDFERVSAAGRAEPEKMFCTFRFGRSDVECRAVFPVRNHEKYLAEYVYRLRNTLLRCRLRGEDLRNFDLTFGARVVAK